MRSERLLEALRERLDIVDVVSEYVELKRSGQNYKGLCPFHAEKTPSFMVNQEKQIFHCFGCGIGGSAITFIMKSENLSFPEALRFLAKKSGLNLAEFAVEGKHEVAREKLTEVLKEASRIFADNLKRSPDAQSYLRKRGISDGIIEQFSLGYAPRDWHYLLRSLKQKGFPESLILQAGLVSSGEKGLYDTFRDRIIFPIGNLQGEVIAFGGRVMDDSQPKYLNSPDTALFRKGETLYGLHRAKEGIREKGHAVIMEGYFDVLISYQYGFVNAVAPLGTALTKGHVQKLKRFTKKAILVFDGDAAGTSAAKRSIPLLLEQGMKALILLLPEGEDPDSFVRGRGSGPFERLLSGAVTGIDFIVSTSAGDRTDTVREALEMITAARDLIVREELVRELSEKTGMRETVLREELKRLLGKGSERKKGKEEGLSPLASSVCYDEEMLLLSAVIAFPERLNAVRESISLDDIRNGSVRNIFQALLSQGAESLDSLLPLLAEEERVLVTRLAVSQGFDPDHVDKNIEDCLRRIMMRKFDDENRKAEASGNVDILNELLLERRKLIKEAR